jgi:LDH2 family malate/lactate/ureidoglycolate dehydrogenase
VTPRYHASDLLAFATSLLTLATLPEDRARVVAEVLLEGDLLGHTTHGLDMLPRYLQDIAEGRMARDGERIVVSDRAAALTWDGRHLPGPWLVTRAIAEGRARVRAHGVVTVVIRRSHHIGCLQAYLKPVTDEGLVILLMCSDPSAAGVAPHGAVSSAITPNPLAVGIPTGGVPILIDISMSTTTHAMARRVYDEGGRLPGAWLVDAQGSATDDPGVLYRDPRGSMLPLGGLDLGHKGFALALMVEALTSALGGYGRADEPKEWGASVFLQILNPELFGGRQAFTRETSRLVEICHGAAVAPGAEPVRLPGERALAWREEQLREGVQLHPAILPALAVWADRLGVPLPAAKNPRT